jgi:hypothetical protein
VSERETDRQKERERERDGCVPVKKVAETCGETALSFHDVFLKRHLPDIEQWSQSSGSNVS